MRRKINLMGFAVTALLFQVMFLATACAQVKKENEEDGTQLGKNQTHDETKYGVRLVLKYDNTKRVFVGTVENKSKEIAERTRVEVHLSNGTELGPTTPRDLKPGEKFDILLSTNDENFERWSTHAEVGSREHEASESTSGENSEGHNEREKGEHGKKEKSNEGREGGESGEQSGHAEGEGHEEGGDTPKDGAESRDGNRSPITSVDNSYSGVILGLEVKVSYNSSKMILEGTIKNVTSKTIKYIQSEPHITLGVKTVGELGPQKLGHLKPGEMTKTSIDVKKDSKFKNVKFDGYFVHIEVGETGYPTHEGSKKGGQDKEPE